MNAVNEHYYEYYSLDENFSNPIKLECIEGGSIDFNDEDELGANLSISVSLGVNEIFDCKRIAVYQVLNGEKTLFGTFLVATNGDEVDECSKTIMTTCYSTLWPLSKNANESRIYTPLGTNAVAEVKRILETYGIEYTIPDSELTTSTDKDFEIGTSDLERINYLLSTVGYTPLHTDEYGHYLSEPYVLPIDKSTNPYNRRLRGYGADSTLEPLVKNNADIFNIPNVFIRTVTSNDVELVAKYENSNPDSPTSTVNTYRNVSAEQVSDAADYDTLYAKCKADCAEANKNYATVEVRNAPFIPKYQECFVLEHPRITDNVIVKGYHLELSTGEDVVLTCYRIILF